MICPAPSACKQGAMTVIMQAQHEGMSLRQQVCWERHHLLLLTSSMGDTTYWNSRKAIKAGRLATKPKLSYSPGAFLIAANSRKFASKMNCPITKLIGVWRSFQCPSSAWPEASRKLSYQLRSCSICRTTSKMYCTHALARRTQFTTSVLLQQ